MFIYNSLDGRTATECYGQVADYWWALFSFLDYFDFLI